jgi:hypothetical protein
MNPIEEMLVLVTVAKAHGDKTMTIDVQALELLLTNYVLLDERLERLESIVHGSKELSDHPAYGM